MNELTSGRFRGRNQSERGFRFGGYLAHATAGARLERTAPAALLGRGAFLLVILFIFSRIWGLIHAAGGLANRSETDLLWYIALTELVVLSSPPVHLDIESDLRSGGLVARMPQPISYFGARFAESLGAAALRLAVLAPIAVGSVLLLGGELPREPAGLVLALPLVCLGTVLSVLSISAIGSLAIWLNDTSPLYWVWQKLLFTLGGLMLPLEIYPSWLRSLAELTPFAAMLNGPARLAFGADPADALRVAWQLLGWLVVAGIVAALVWSRAARNLEAYGG